MAEQISVSKVLRNALPLFLRTFAQCGPLAAAIAVLEFLGHIDSTPAFPRSLTGWLSTLGPWGVFFPANDLQMSGAPLLLLIVIEPFLKSTVYAAQIASVSAQSRSLKVALSRGYRCWGKALRAAILFGLITAAVMAGCILLVDCSWAMFSFVDSSAIPHGAPPRSWDDVATGLAFVGTIIVYVRLQFWLAAIVRDDAGARKALRISLDLTEYEWRHALTLYAVVYLVVIAVKVVFSGIGLFVEIFGDFSVHARTVMLIAFWDGSGVVAVPASASLVLLMYEQFRRHSCRSPLPQQTQGT